MLKRLELENFKGFEKCEVALKPLSFLVGANASGKSNLFDAIRFLQGVGLGMPYSEIFAGRWEGGRETWPPLRGGAVEAARAKKLGFLIRSHWGMASAEVEHYVALRVKPEPHAIAEAAGLAESDRWIINSHAGTLKKKAGARQGGVLRVGLARQGAGKDLAEDFSNHRSVLTQISPKPALRPSVLECRDLVLRAFRSCRFIDLHPSSMRGYVSKQVREMGLQGQNLSGILWQLCQQSEEKERIVDWLGELCAPEVEDIGFVETEIGDVMLRIKELGGHWVSARSLSDGTLRFLGLLVALHTATEDTTLLVEEIDNGLHPSRISLLVQLLNNYTQARPVQVIATTHSAYLLSQLSKPVLNDCLLLARDPIQRVSRTSRLGDLPDFEKVLEKRSFEHLFTTRWLERAL